MIIILDFGSQTTHLIGRRLRDLGIEIKILDPEISTNEIRKIKSAGIILSGGPASVYQNDAPSVTKRIFNLGIPILGICYGWQLTAHLLGGKVASGHKEYGPEVLNVKRKGNAEGLLTGLPSKFRAWLSHGDTVVRLPPGFRLLGSTPKVKTALAADLKRKIYGTQFHPEVTHTQFGEKVLQNFAQRICQLKVSRQRVNIKKIIQEIKQTVGEDRVIGGVSGGIDSTTTAILMARAVGKNFTPVFVDNGLMRLGTKEAVKKVFKDLVGIKPVIVPAKGLFLRKLKGVVDPEQKRKIIGRLYIRLFEREAKKIKGAKFLVQGTIYSDVIESKGTRKAAKIKSHHNVAALPKQLNLKLLEPLRFFYKDEVRKIARRLGLPNEIVYQQPFPGPGQAIRIIGEVTTSRLKKQQQADQIILEELKKAHKLRRVFQSFPVSTGIKSTAVKGDARFYGEVIALRIYESADIMTASWAKLPYVLLGKMATRIVNEVPGVSRVVYDITTKPPATMEWE